MLGIGIFGQSFGEALAQGAGLDGFTFELEQAGYTLSVTSHAIGGSAALKENNSSNYWWDFDAHENGPLLDAAISKINSASVKPSIVLWVQGEGDAVPGIDPNRFETATRWIVWRLKQACNSADPQSVRVYQHVVGRTAWTRPEVQVIREEQLRLFDDTSINFLADLYDLPLKAEDPLNRFPGDRHHFPKENAEFGYRAAQTVLRDLGKPHLSGPKISTITRISDISISVQFDVSAPLSLVKPSYLSHFAIRTASGLYEGELLFNWSGDNLEITAPDIPENSKLLYPYGEMVYFDRENIIRDSNGTALNSAGLVIV